MLIKFFPNGKGTGSGTVRYLVAQTVLAYDENRDLIRDANGQPLSVSREPLPEVLRGDPNSTEALIDACPHVWSYRAGVIAFAAEDAPSEAGQREIMDHFEALAFAGLDAHSYDMLWVRHSHEGRVELHFCTPRMELESGKSLNIAPPGYQAAFDSLRDLMNKTHGWADPMDADHAREVRRVEERPDRAQGREGLQGWILDQISVGLIEDRTQMVAALTEAGYELPRQGKEYITVSDPETGDRWRLKGEIFHEDWQAGADAPERKTERGTGRDPAGVRRLDGISIGELQAGFGEHCDRRARYNRERYAQDHGVERAGIEQSPEREFALDHNRTLGDGGDCSRFSGDVGCAELDLEPGDRGAAGAEECAYRAEHRTRGDQLPASAAGADRADSLHHQRREVALSQEEGTLNERATHRVGTRIAELRRAVGRRLRELSPAVARLGVALDRADRTETRLLGRLRDSAAEVAGHVGRCVEGVAERIRELRDAGATLGRKFETNEGRRETIERELKARFDIAREWEP
ncbi:MAG: relaxase/mobilization nuclease domain-containing protein [Paracoccaceae bacterium]